MSDLIQWLKVVDSFIYPCLLVQFWLLISFFKMENSDRWVALTVMVYGVNDIVSSLMAYHKMHNLWFYNLMLFPQFILVIAVLTKNLRNKKIQLTLIAGGALLLLFH